MNLENDGDSKSIKSIDLLVEKSMESIKEVSDTIAISYKERDWEQIDDTVHEDPELGLPEELRSFTAKDITGEEYRFGSSSWVGFEDSPIAAIDTGLISLGELRNGGFGIAIRGSIIVRDHPSSDPRIFKYRTGPIIVTDEGMTPLLKFIGKELGHEDLYIDKTDSGERVKPFLEESPDKLKDRFRDFVEKKLQYRAFEILRQRGEGILLIDGALAVTFDTPTKFLEEFIYDCKNNGISVFALSKNSRLNINGKLIYQIFNNNPVDFTGYKELLSFIQSSRRKESEKRRTDVTKADSLYAIKFSLTGKTFRIDVNPRKGNLPAEVIEAVYNLVGFRQGYPQPLIEAHWFSCFNKPDIMNMETELRVEYGIRSQSDVSMKPIFSPFGGRYK